MNSESVRGFYTDILNNIQIRRVATSPESEAAPSSCRDRYPNLLTVHYGMCSL